MKKVIVRRALICVFLVLPLVAFVWILSNATLFFSRLAPDGDEWAFYATRAEMMARKYDGPVHWFRGWRAVPKDAVDIAYVGVTTPEGCGPWETRLTCRTTSEAFLEMARDYGYTVSENHRISANYTRTRCDLWYTMPQTIQDFVFNTSFWYW